MSKYSRKLSSHALASTILIVVIASLCFSVGEGLRLTPFPPSAPAQVEAADVLLNANASPGASIYKYGPLDVPAQAQKRSKRQQIDFACPPAIGARELPTDQRSSSDDKSDHVVSVSSVSRPAGRAPPLVS